MPRTYWCTEATEGQMSRFEVFNFTHKGDKFPEGTRKYQKEMFVAVKKRYRDQNLPVVPPSMAGENADLMGKSKQCCGIT